MIEFLYMELERGAQVSVAQCQNVAHSETVLCQVALSKLHL